MVNGYYDMDVADAFSRVYTWLRYSSTRKLTWQRNYNTQPRILSAAQERLTNTIANAHSRTSGELLLLSGGSLAATTTVRARGVTARGLPAGPGER